MLSNSSRWFPFPNTLVTPQPKWTHTEMVHVTCFSNPRNCFLKKMRRAPRGAHRIFFKKQFLRFEMVCFIAKSKCQAGAKLFFQKNVSSFSNTCDACNSEFNGYFGGQVLPGWQAGRVELASKVFTRSSKWVDRLAAVKKFESSSRVTARMSLKEYSQST